MTKVNLAAEAAAATEGNEEDALTFETLLELAPNKAALTKLTKTKDEGDKLIDFLYTYKNKDLAKARKEFKQMEEFVSKLSAYIMQELEDSSLTGASGKVGQVTIKDKDVATVKDWQKFYAYIKRNNAFELLNKAVNQKSVAERWEDKKKIPGVEAFNKKSLSITKA